MSAKGCLELEQIEQYLSGELEDSARQRFETHLSACGACRQTLAEAASNLNAAVEVQRAEIPPDQLGARDEPGSPPPTMTAGVAPSGEKTAEAGTAGGEGPAAVTIEGYRIVRELSRGGQGVVYEAVQQATKRKVAIKVLREGHFADRHERGRFEREVSILGQLKHPHIVRIYDSGSVGDNAYYVMDYISGKLLDIYMSESKPAIEETLRLFAKICDGVHAAHLQGIIHRDLKPSNIQIDAEGQPQIVDFGLAKVAGSATDASFMTMTGQFIGSLPWSSPEQAEGVPGKIDIRTDVYSLGVILYQMLTGRFPYEVIGTMREVLDRIMKAEPAKPSTIRKQIDDEVETIVLKCLQKERERRYQSAGEIARDIGHYLAGEAIEARRDSGWYLLKKTIRRCWLPAVVAAAFVLLLAGSSVVSTVLWQRAGAAERLQHAERERAEREAAKALATAEFLAGMLRSADPIADGPNMTIASILDRSSRELRGSFADAPDVEASLRSAIGLAYRGLGLLGPAKRELAVALDLRRSALGPAARDTLVALNNLAAVYRDRGEPREAELLLLELLDNGRGSLRDDDRFTHYVSDNLARAVQDQGRLDEAERLYRRALEGRERLAAEHPEDLLLSMNNLGTLLFERQQFPDAADLLERTAELQERVLPPRDPRRLDTQTSLASARTGQGDARGAAAAYRRALEMCRDILPPAHPTTLRTERFLAWTLHQLGASEDAARLLQTSLDAHKTKLGRAHADTLVAMHLYTEVLLDLGQLDEAQQILDEAPAIQASNPPADATIGLRGDANRAALLAARHEYGEAERVAQRVLDMRRQELGESHTHTLKSANQLGRLLLENQQPDKAEPHLRHACRGAAERLGADHWLAASCRSDLGACLLRLRRHDEAETELRPAYLALEAALGGEHRETREAAARLFELYSVLDRPEEAARFRILAGEATHEPPAEVP